MAIKTFKMWEDAAANSAGGGGIAGIGVGPKGEPGVHMKKKKKKLSDKEKEILLKFKKRQEASSRLSGPGNASKGDWEKRSRQSQAVRKQMWANIFKKTK
tara:strand:- start:909 stop:1208 length:300 start_codon:yes stop_codon:yes gene_type:complete